VSAGGPPGLTIRADGTAEELESSGMPLGVMDDADYEEAQACFAEKDCLLFFSDGAAEVHNAQEELLGVAGLARILKALGYPASRLCMSSVEEQLLVYSNEIRLNDDLTFIEVRF
jgi:phosphoserine phosphatase RsbU/P